MRRNPARQGNLDTHMHTYCNEQEPSSLAHACMFFIFRYAYQLAKWAAERSVSVSGSAYAAFKKTAVSLDNLR